MKHVQCLVIEDKDLEGSVDDDRVISRLKPCAKRAAVAAELIIHKGRVIKYRHGEIPYDDDRSRELTETCDSTLKSEERVPVCLAYVHVDCAPRSNVHVDGAPRSSDTKPFMAVRGRREEVEAKLARIEVAAKGTDRLGSGKSLRCYAVPFYESVSCLEEEEKRRSKELLVERIGKEAAASFIF